MAVHATLQSAVQLVEDAKTKDVWGPFWQRKSTASGLRWKVPWRMWLVYSWAISQLSCLFCIVHTPKIRSPPQVDKIGPVKTPFPPQVDKNPIAFPMNPLSLEGLWTLLPEPLDSYVMTLDTSATAATAFTRGSSANPWFPCLTCFYFEVYWEHLIADFMHPCFSCIGVYKSIPPFNLNHGRCSLSKEVENSLYPAKHSPRW